MQTKVPTEKPRTVVSVSASKKAHKRESDVCIIHCVQLINVLACDIVLGNLYVPVSERAKNDKI